MTQVKPISTHIPDDSIESINTLIKKGRYVNQSEFIREAIRQLIRIEQQAMETDKKIIIVHNNQTSKEE